MRTIVQFLALALLTLGSVAQAAHTQARLIFSTSAAKPGETVLAGIHLRMDPEWHIYWKNPGASGIPTSIEWELPPGVAATEIQWPVPHKLPPDELTTYVYEKEVVLIVPLQISPEAKPGELTLKAKVAWLECKEQCLPGDANVSAKLVIGDATIASPDAALIGSWQRRVPNLFEGTVHAVWETPKSDKLRPVVIEWTSPHKGDADFYPFASEDFEVLADVERLSSETGKIRLRKIVKRFEADWPKDISGVLIEGKGEEKSGFQMLASIEAGTATGGGTETESINAAAARPLWEMLLYAFLGGMILNIMPCVLPVIALKILGFVSESRSEPKHVRKLGMVYGLGVLVSFLALAVLVIGVTAAGKQAGWGMQFGNGPFLVGLTVLVTLVALSLFGLFEINPGARVLNSAGTLASKQGSSGAFFNGVLATILATPCTAPFLGVALGFAFAQPPAIIVLMFLTIGLGLAFPYVLLSFQPAWLKFLPKPGAWMERFKVAMGFPMLATAVWLFSLTFSFYGEDAWLVALFMVVIGCAAWIYGEFIQRSRARPIVTWATLLALLAGGYVYVLEKELNWRHPSAISTNGKISNKADGIQWQPWSREAVAQAQSEGRPVLVDFTAKYCLTCKANKKFAIEIPSVKAKLKEINAVALIGDNTLFPPAIAEELARHGREGVPLVLVFPGQPGAPPEILPATLTPGIVLNALDRAAKKNS